MHRSMQARDWQAVSKKAIDACRRPGVVMMAMDSVDITRSVEGGSPEATADRLARSGTLIRKRRRPLREAYRDYSCMPFGTNRPYMCHGAFLVTSMREEFKTLASGPEGVRAVAGRAELSGFFRLLCCRKYSVGGGFIWPSFGALGKPVLASPARRPLNA